MDLELRDVGDVVVLELCGKLTAGDGDDLLRATVDRLLAGGQPRILLNLAKVPYMDSMGIGEIMSTRQKAAIAGGIVKLLNPLKRVYDVLQIVKLDTVFEIYQDEATAIASFRVRGPSAPT